MTPKFKAGNIVVKTSGKWAGKGRSFMVLACGSHRMRLQPLFKVCGYEFDPISETISGRWVLEDKYRRAARRTAA